MKINNISGNSPLRSGFVMTFINTSRWIECPNTRKSIGNGFPMQKYVGSVVRKLSQLIIVTETDRFENKNHLSKKIQEIYGSLKNKTICGRGPLVTGFMDI